MGRRDPRAKPYQRSITTHIRSIELSATQNTAIPVLESEGIDVSDWLSIILSVHPTNPDISSITAGANVVLRPWRYKRASREGTNPGSGQWYADIDITIPLDGDGTSQMERSFAVWDSEKIYFQVVSVADPGAETPTFRLEHFGIGPKYAESPDFFEGVTASAAAAASGTTDVNLIQVAGNAVNVGAGAAGTGTLRVILASDSPGIGEHDVATADAGFRTLFVATDVDPADVDNGDDVHPIATLGGRAIIAGYDRLGDLVRIQETDPINFHIAWDLIEESSMGTTGSPYEYFIDLDSYYRMAVQDDITLGSADAGDVEIKFYGTAEDDDPDLTARNYIDLTSDWTGVASITVDDLIPDTNGFWGNCTAVKIEVSVTNASDDSAIRLDVKRFVGG